MRKLKYVKLFENFYDEELLETDKSSDITVDGTSIKDWVASLSDKAGRRDSAGVVQQITTLMIVQMINKLENNEDLPLEIDISETYINNKISYFLSVSKPGIEKGKVDGDLPIRLGDDVFISADMIRVSGDSLKNMTQEQFEKLYNLLPYKGGRKGDRWANNWAKINREWKYNTRRF
jgi:hypothetical protein